MRLFVLLFFLLSFVDARSVFADCVGGHSKSCEKMALLRAEKKYITNFFTQKNFCDVEFEEAKSKKRWNVVMESCPKFEGNRYVYVKKSCSDSISELLTMNPDKVEIWSDENPCILGDYIQTRERFRSVLPGTNVEKLKELGLQRIAKDGIRWTYHSHPGNSIVLEVSNPSCGDKDSCDVTSGWKVSRILDFRVEYLNFDEIESKY